MPLSQLEHFLIYAKDLEATKEFYITVLGLTVGPRPNFSFFGYWLYLNETPVVHLVSTNSSNEDQKKYLDSTFQTDIAGSGAIDHIAFNAINFEEMCNHFTKLGIPMRHRTVPEENGLKQVFIRDPNGIGIELNFRS